MKTETTRAVSEARVAANRRNAQKSTGPTSAQGKAVSRLNARKHRSLAQSVLVRGGELREPAHEFTALCQEYYASLAPVGPLEEMLVDEIVQATWRLRRARTAESGEIALSVDEGWRRRQDQNPVARILAQGKSPFSGLLRPKLERSVDGCAYLRVCLQKLRTAVEAEGELTDEALADFKASLGDEPDVFVSRLEFIQSKGPGWTEQQITEDEDENEVENEAEAAGSEAETEEGPSRTGQQIAEDENENEEEDAEARAAHKAKVMELIEGEVTRLLSVEEESEKRERLEERLRQAASVLPGVTVLDRILRYEKGLERQLYGAMRQLQQLQTKGCPMKRVKGKRTKARNRMKKTNPSPSRTGYW